MIFDTHAHFDDEAFDGDREELLASLQENNIGCVVNVSASMASVETSRKLSEIYPFVYTSVGVHPDEIRELDEAAYEKLARDAEYEKCVAIGEIGLDYHWNKDNKEQQAAAFRRQLKIAKDLKKPVIIHSREAANDTFEIMKEAHAAGIGGVIHCYSYSWEMAREYIKMGYFIGVGGVLTFKNAGKLKEVVKNAPLENLVLETDCPYLAPVPHRGERNSSLNLKYVVETMAEIKGVSKEEIERITWDNACRLYEVNYNET